MTALIILRNNIWLNIAWIYIVIGGIEEMEKSTHYKYHKGFSGCVSELTLNSDYHIKLTWSVETADHCGDMPP